MLFITQGNHYCSMAPIPELRSVIEVRKLMGTYMLNSLSKNYNKRFWTFP